jgi:NADPH:quinone reductase-like Zn-dependent oxidoreductase
MPARYWRILDFEPIWKLSMNSVQLRDSFGIDSLALVVDVGGQDTLNQSVKALKPGGFIAVVGLLTGIECKLDVLTFLLHHSRLEGITVGSRQSFEEMNRFLEEHQIRPVVDAVFPWSKTQEALRELKAGKHFGKLILRPN